VTSLTAASTDLRPRLIWRLAAILLCLALAAIIMAGIGWLVSGAATPPPPARPSPFGVGPREAAPVTTGLAGWLLQHQAQFFRSLTQGVRAAADNPAALASLIGLGFAYGVFHAAGPGHGKAVISAYIIADRSSLKRAFALSLAVALVQAMGAVLIVTILGLLIRATVFTQTKVTQQIDMAAFIVLALVGLWLLWRKSGQVAALIAGTPVDASCDHVHLPGPEQLARMGWKETALMVLAAGARPCMGTIVVLTFALSAGAFGIGLAAALAIGFGVALTTSALAMLAVLFKNAALSLAGGRGGLIGAKGLAILEGTAAAFILLLGLTLAWGLGVLPGRS
jgi:nickel/cobalt transporter (NicO) family protein